MADIYCDLCIQEGEQCKEVLERLISHGTSIICINRNVNLTGFKFPDEKLVSESKKGRLKFRAALQEKVKPMDLSSFNEAFLKRYNQIQGVSVKLFSRITIYFEECDEIQLFTQFFKNDVSKHFDVVAVCPGSDSALNFTYDQLSIVDLIQLDTSVKPSFRLSHQVVRRARDKALSFELLLAPMLNNSSCRSYTVSVAQNLIDITGGRSLVFSSGAASVWDVRNHIGMIVMVTMLGVRPDLASHCVRDTPKSVMKHALIRTRTVFGAMAIEKLQRQPGVKSVSIARNDSHGNRNQQVDKRNRFAGYVDLDRSMEPVKKKQKTKGQFH